LLFFRGSPDDQVEVRMFNKKNENFYSKIVDKSELSILQLAVMSGSLDTVKFILEEFRITLQARLTRKVNPRIILTNFMDEEDESLTLRLAIQDDQQVTFEYLWNEFGFLYNYSILNTVVRFILL